MAVRVQEAASYRIDEIYRYTSEHWSADKASRYITGLFEAFERIENHDIMSRPILAALASKVTFAVTNSTSFTGGVYRAAISAS